MRPSSRCIGIEVPGGDAPSRRVLPQDPAASAALAHAEASEGFRPGARAGYRLSRFILRVTWSTTGHEHSSHQCRTDLLTGGPGFEPELAHPKCAVLPTTPPPKGALSIGGCRAALR